MANKGTEMEVDGKETQGPVPSSSSEVRKRFEVKKWDAVALWGWNITVDRCAICRVHLMETCNECQVNPAATAKDCTIAWGVCNHAFHFHCISRWLLNGHKTCPLDNAEWEIKKYGH